MKYTAAFMFRAVNKLLYLFFSGSFTFYPITTDYCIIVSELISIVDFVMNTTELGIYKKGNIKNGNNRKERELNHKGIKNKTDLTINERSVDL